ncbi:MAG: ABC transporter permease [Lachnospiraceae bacterium]|nr:ABC transporter permease [Lachnospiraceae bacterium]
MRFFDIIAMSASNLWKRKVRTILTILGVMIGTASIVVMLSLGIGLKQAVMEEMSAYGSLTEVTVSGSNYSSDSKNKVQLDDQAIQDFLMMDHVVGVRPELRISARFVQGKYSCYIDLIGTTPEFLETIPLGQGSYTPGSNELQLIIGNMVIQSFYVTKTYEYPFYERGVLPEIDYFNGNLYTEFEPGYTPDQKQVPVRKQKLKIAGVVEGGPQDYNMYGYQVYCELDALKHFLKKNYRNCIIPGQPTSKSGKPLKDIVYSGLQVEVDESANVSTVLTTIQEMGYYAYSEAEWIKQQEQEMGIIQMVLGGIGAVSLLVAAIGIANTMMMSTYERTKEIGVMKVLGCSLGNIRALFLTEAAFIGFLGGMVGLVISYTISFVINKVLPDAMGYGSTKISVIPFWLVLVAMAFSTLVGIVAGFFPAQRATRLSALSAIRNE